MGYATILSTVIQQASSRPQPRGLVTLFRSTGFVGPLLVVLGAVALALALRRWMELRTRSLAPEPLREGLDRAVRDGKLASAREQASTSRTCLGVVVADGLSLSAGGLDEMLASVERTTMRESLRYANRIANLARLGVIILLIGALGTVMGLVSTMQVLAVLVSPTVGDFAGGIGDSFVCTALGMAVALLSFVAYFVLNHRLAQRTFAVRNIAEELMHVAASTLRPSAR
jgi:biopolymer transport protein ExbB